MRRKMSHPGKFLQKIVLPGFGFTTTEASKLTGISIAELENLFAGTVPLDKATAAKLAALGVDPQTMLNMQASHDETSHL